MLGHARGDRRRRRADRRPRAHVGERHRARAADRPRGRLDRRARRGRRPRLQHLRALRPRRRGAGRPTARSTCSTSRSAARRTGSPRTRRPARRSCVTETAGGVELGMSICYDLRFPELYRILAVRGARILLVPAAFTLATTREHWEVLLRARAIEDQAFVIAANQVGQHAPGLPLRRALDDRRPVGDRDRPGARRRDLRDRRPGPRAPGGGPPPGPVARQPAPRRLPMADARCTA